MSDSSRGRFSLDAVVTFAVVALVVAALAGPALGMLATPGFDTRTATVDLAVGENTTLASNATVALVGSDGTNATWEIAERGQSQQFSLSAGENASVTVAGESYTATAVGVTANSATLQVEWTIDPGVWADLWILAPVFAIIALGIYLLKFPDEL